MRDAFIRAGSLIALAGSTALGLACVLPWHSEDGRAEAVDTATSTEASSRAETDEAVAILERMSAFLASRNAFRFHAEVRYDAVQDSGQRIEFGEWREIVVRRPDRLRIETLDWNGSREIISYDGAHVWVAAPSRRAYSRIDQTGPLERVLERLSIEYDSPAPFAELISPDLYERIGSSIESGSRVGLVRIDGRLCEQLAFRAATLDFQLFVERGEAPIPRRLVIDYREAPGRPQFRATLSDWTLSPELPDVYFRVSPPIGAQRMNFDELLELMLEPETERTNRRGAP